MNVLNIALGLARFFLLVYAAHLLDTLLDAKVQICVIRSNRACLISQSVLTGIFEFLGFSNEVEILAVVNRNLRYNHIPTHNH